MTGNPAIHRLFRYLALAAGGGLIWLAIQPVITQSATFDEFHHLSAGWSYWQTGDFRLNPEHPPLVKLAAALPLLLLPTVPLDFPRYESWRSGNSVLFQLDYYYRQPPGQLSTQLAAGRLAAGLCWLAAGLLVALAAWRLGGPAAAWLAGLLYLLEPNLSAHGFLITTDMAAGLVFTGFALAAARFLRSGSRRSAGWLVAAAALGPVTKFSLLILPPLAVLMFAIRWFIAERREGWRKNLLRLAGRPAVLLLAGWLLLLAVYGFAWRGFSPAAVWRCIQGVEPPPEAAGGGMLPLPEPFLRGVARLGTHLREGHPAFLDGEVFRHGRWEYFPRLALYKIPLVLLLAGMAGWVFWLSRGRRDPALFCLAALPLLYFLLACSGGLNLGIRHLLPVIPLLVLAAACTIASLLRADRPRVWRTATGLLVLLLAAEVLTSGSDRLAYYNRMVLPGGKPWTHFSDSNLDWGQNLLRLLPELRGVTLPEPPRLALSGFEDPGRRGLANFHLATAGPLELQGLPYRIESREVPVIPGVYAVSTGLWTVVRQDPQGNEVFSRFFRRTPEAMAGRTIFIHRLTEQDRPQFGNLTIWLHRLRSIRLSDGTTIPLEE